MLDIRSTVSWIKDNLADEKLADTVRRCAVQNSWRLRSILRADGLKRTFTQIPVPDVEMSTHTEALERRASGLRAERTQLREKPYKLNTTNCMHVIG